MLNSKCTLWLLWLCCTSSLGAQEFNLEYDDLGKPFLANVVFMELENAHLVPRFSPHQIALAVGQGIDKIPNVGDVSSAKALKFARNKYSTDPYKHLKDDGRHYMVRIIANDGGIIRGKLKNRITKKIKDHEYTRYIDLSLYLINVATSKVEKVVNIHAHSKPYYKIAESQKSKYPKMNIHSFALSESIIAEVKKELATFFTNVYPIMEIVEETKDKVNNVNMKFRGKKNKDIHTVLDIVKVVQDKNTPHGHFRSFKRIGSVKQNRKKSKRGIANYDVRKGAKRLKKALAEGYTIYLTPQAKAL